MIKYSKAFKMVLVISVSQDVYILKSIINTAAELY
jgi:hypothetical protein